MIIILCLAGIADICQAQVRSDSSCVSGIPASSENPEIPDFEKCFRILEKNRRTYNRYNLNILATYPRAIKYLTEKERIYYLNELNVATQVTTYAH